jgi:hypothetical protein
MKMQNDAIRRVEDMQRRARQSAGLESEKKKEEPKVIVRDEPRRVPMPNDYLEKLKELAEDSGKPRNNRAAEAPKPEKKDSFSDFEMDSDTALLLSLVMLLSEEKADETLIMALLYMLT